MLKNTKESDTCSIDYSIEGINGAIKIILKDWIECDDKKSKILKYLKDRFKKSVDMNSEDFEKEKMNIVRNFISVKDDWNKILYSKEQFNDLMKLIDLNSIRKIDEIPPFKEFLAEIWETIRLIKNEIEKRNNEIMSSSEDIVYRKWAKDEIIDKNLQNFWEWWISVERNNSKKSVKKLEKKPEKKPEKKLVKKPVKKNKSWNIIIQ